MKLTTIAAALALSAGTFGSQAVLAQDVTLQMVVWNYSIDTIQDNLREFEAQYPGIKVELTDFPWTEYENALVLRLRNRTPTDVIYGGQDWLPAWAAAGFLAPLDDVVSAEQLAGLKADLAGFALSDVTYQGKTYGLPYYADTISLLYNKKTRRCRHSSPDDVEEVTTAAESLRQAGWNSDSLRVQRRASQLL